ncbi:hypothetical protein OS493_008567 [Desmophyllum pertusum]|uniref:BHLH domain-containing protein n=1 Tax=Desmophyllum pertusum TaxID=174260 RepID=A0A9W9ZUY9_9CNID|nr:hypothetical protein OS493_008567 [Desmophyllum pertusum]
MNKMWLNPTYIRSEAAIMQVTYPEEETYSNETLVLNQSPTPTPWAEQFHQEQQNRISNHASSKPLMVDKLRKRRENNCNRERGRQRRIREAFNVLRTVIPDYLSEREPGDRLSRIQTLRMAKNYIVMLYEMLEKST